MGLSTGSIMIEAVPTKIKVHEIILNFWGAPTVKVSFYNKIICGDVADFYCSIMRLDFNGKALEGELKLFNKSFGNIFVNIKGSIDTPDQLKKALGNGTIIIDNNPPLISLLGITDE